MISAAANMRQSQFSVKIPGQISAAINRMRSFRLRGKAGRAPYPPKRGNSAAIGGHHDRIASMNLSDRLTGIRHVRSFRWHDEYARELLNAVPPPDQATAEDPSDVRPPCPCCGGRMIVIEIFKRWRQPRGPPNTMVTNRENAP